MDHTRWHLRVPTYKNEQRYQNLIVLNQLTQTWNAETSTELELLFHHSLSHHLDAPQAQAAEADELLDHFEKRTWQSHLNSIKKHKNLNSLETLSWDHGQLIAKKWWHSCFPIKTPWPLDQLWIALQNFPLTPSHSESLFFVKRATAIEIILLLQNCPHKNPWIPSEFSNPLCQLHSHWTRGFLQSLNPQLQIDHQVKYPNCTQRWFFK